MKTIFSLMLLCAFGLHVSAQSLKSILVNQLKTTHDKQEWFVPVKIALEGVTAEQAVWNDDSGNHSIGQLAHHLLFWNERVLVKLKGEQQAPFDGSNEKTFDSFNKAQWEQTVKRLSEVLQEFESMIQNGDEDFLKTWAETIANISTHNAYHTGQIIFVRKLQGSWNPENGVK